MNKRRKPNQVNMFPDSNMMSLEEYKKRNGKRIQHEKILMKDMMRIAKSLDLPCIHIEYFCGNKFYAVCQTCSKKSPVYAVCPCCGKRVLAHCVNRINKHLSGQYDILGIEWGMETKHKINKGKQDAKRGKSMRQQIQGLVYDLDGVPHLTINEDDVQRGFEFLQTIRERHK